MTKIIRKYSGETEPFSEEKFTTSLRKAGAQQKYIDQIIAEVRTKKDIKSTQELYEFAFERLRHISPAMAAKYNLKQALIRLGPTGFPFEAFLGQLYKEKGYEVQIGKRVPGTCVWHEMDVVAIKKDHTVMIEAKFHNSQGLKTDIQTSLYVKARFDDIIPHFKKEKQTKVIGCLVSNTRFTSEAIMYAECAQLNLIGWNYPQGNSLPEEIEKHHLIPITALTNLSEKQMRTLIKKGCVLCRDVKNHADDLRKLKLSEDQIEKIVNEAEDVCKL